MSMTSRLRCGALAVAAACGVLASGCGRDPAGRGAPGVFTAEIRRGAEVIRYEGDGKFYSDSRQERGPRSSFTLTSDAERGSTREGLTIHGQNVTRPPVGRYELGLLDQSDFDAQGFFAFYGRADPVQGEGYAAVSGELVVTESSPERFAGTVRMTARRYCYSKNFSGEPPRCAMPWLPPDTAPTVEVVGSFSAEPARGFVDY